MACQHKQFLRQGHILNIQIFLLGFLESLLYRNEEITYTHQMLQFLHQLENFELELQFRLKLNQLLELDHLQLFELAKIELAYQLLI
jgi:hypothetical protein